MKKQKKRKTIDKRENVDKVPKNIKYASDDQVKKAVNVVIQKYGSALKELANH